eukprot:7497932-Alexandrium_andersonii.AAC.1
MLWRCSFVLGGTCRPRGLRSWPPPWEAAPPPLGASSSCSCVGGVSSCCTRARGYCSRSACP